MTTLARVAEALRVLGDETRLRIMHLLWRHQPHAWSVGEIVDALQRPQPTVSRHLAMLKHEGLLRCETRGQVRLYSLPETQPSDHVALLGALEELVPNTPTALSDAARARGRELGLTARASNATTALHDDADAEGDAAMTEVLRALSHPTRRRLLDEVGARPGLTLGELAHGEETSRAAIGKHLAVLERAGLVVSRRDGRKRRLFHNAVPIQLVYDRWTSRFSAPIARHVADLKYRMEKR